jgi:hypothetical protein
MLNKTPRITLDHVWIATILSLIWLFVSITPLPPNDLWWHMAAGRTMVQEGAWMFTNRWAYTVPYDAVFVLQSWLSEILLYGLWRLGDVPLLALVRTVAITGGYGLIAWHAWRRSAQGKAVALALLFAIMVGWNNWTLRPQTLALLPAALFIVVLGEYLGGRLAARWLTGLPLLLLFWVNMHGSFMLGIGLLGLAWLGVLLEAMRRGDDTTAVLARQQVGPLTLVTLVTMPITLLQPLGVGIFGYVRMTMGHPLHDKWFVEWLPPQNDVDITNTGFWFFALVLLLAVLMARGPRRPSATDLFWYCGLAWLTFGGVRYAMWFALLLLPLLADQLAPLFARRSPVPLNTRFAAVIGLLLGGMMVATLPWLQPGRYLGAESSRLFASAGRYPWLLSSATPVAATDWMEENSIEGNFWTDMSYSSYTIWKLPQKQVFVDLRVELFPEAVWRDYFAIARGDKQSLKVLDKWDITHLLLDRYWQESLYHELLRTSEWCERYQDKRSALFARCN